MAPIRISISLRPDLSFRFRLPLEASAPDVTGKLLLHNHLRFMRI
jgi:hypothetical protein